MRRAMLVCLIVGIGAVVGAPGAALAGGGCHTGATQADETGEKEATVRMIDACFTASVTRVDPGTPVTFVNLDSGKITHNVGGNEWGHFEDMTKGDAFRATFADPGIYPFACSYHPGMTGAIVVGDGTGAGTGWTVSTDPFEPAPKSVTRVVTTNEGPPVGILAAAGVLGIALGAAIAVGLTRSGRKSATA